MIGNYLIKALFLVLIIIAVFLFFRFFERRNLYFPLRHIEAVPGDFGMNYENIELIAEDGIRITGWYIPSNKPRAVLIFCHGNGGNISHRMDKIKVFNDLNADVLIFDYRGYGESEGSPSENGLYFDAEAVYQYLIKDRKVSPGTIIAYGESLGGAVAVHLAAGHTMGALIIEGGFTSVRDMAKRYFPFIPTFIYKSRYDSLKKIRGLQVPLLLLHSEGDEIVPFELGKRLYEAAEGPKDFIWLSGGHNDAFLVSRDIFESGIASFLDRHMN
jgi:fermentation-respiration switch protein FrsA (DUF1100 family)